MIRLAVAAGLSVLVGTAQAGPTDKIAEKSAKFCTQTEAGKRYPSTEACLEAQKEGAAIVQNALDQGHAHVPMGCLMLGNHRSHRIFASNINKALWRPDALGNALGNAADRRKWLFRT